MMRLTTVAILSALSVAPAAICETRHKRSIDERHVQRSAGAEIGRSSAVEVHLLKGEIATGAGATVTETDIELFTDAAKTRSTRLVPIREIHQIHYLRRYRSESVVRGVLGALAGVLVAATAAYALGSAGHDRAGAIVLGTAPVAGAALALRRSAEKQWEKITIRH